MLLCYCTVEPREQEPPFTVRFTQPPFEALKVVHLTSSRLIPDSQSGEASSTRTAEHSNTVVLVLLCYQCYCTFQFIDGRRTPDILYRTQRPRPCIPRTRQCVYHSASTLHLQIFKWLQVQYATVALLSLIANAPQILTPVALKLVP